MNRPDLDAIRARLEATTEGEWFADSSGLLFDDEIGGATLVGRDRSGHTAFFRKENADFAAHAHQDIPDLLDYIEELEAEAHRLKMVNGGEVIPKAIFDSGMQWAQSLRKRLAEEIGEEEAAKYDGRI